MTERRPAYEPDREGNGSQDENGPPDPPIDPSDGIHEEAEEPPERPIREPEETKED